MAGDPNGNDAFYAAILAGIGAPVTSGNLAVMRAWHKMEGGPRTAKYNPFNTGQTLDRTVHPFGHIKGTPFNGGTKVLNYGSQADGVRATVSNLQNGMYDDVVKAFRRGDATSAVRAIVMSPWEETHYGAKVVSGAPVPSTSRLWSVYAQDNDITNPGVDTPEPDDESWWETLGDNVWPDNTNPIDAINALGQQVQGVIEVVSAPVKAVQWLYDHRVQIGIGILGVILIGIAVGLANRGNIETAVTTATKVI